MFGMARGPQGERGPQGAEGPEGPRGSIGLWTALAILLVGMGVATGVIISGAVGSDDERPSGAPLFAANFGTPGSPQPIQQSAEYDHFDVQVHSRDNNTWGDSSLESMMAQHGPDCSGPPAAHENHSYVGTVFVCNNHLMTAMNASGYGEIMLTPSQLLNCSAGCSVTFDLSSENMSGRDWPDIWLTPWDDNLTLPLEDWLPDLNGPPRRAIHITSNNGSHAWGGETYDNYVPSSYLSTMWWVGMGEGIAAGTNKSAVRQTWKITIQSGGLKLERLASDTATAQIWTFDPQGNFGFSQCACLLASDYVVQFGHHSYNPTKDEGGGGGVPATWHWFNPTSPVISPSSPFTVIHSTPRMVQGSGGTITFNSPAPADARLRFSGVCKVLIDGVEKPRQRHLRDGSADGYFVPIAQGKQSVSVSFAADGGYTGPCIAQDFHIWAKAGSAPVSTPTPPPVGPTPTPVVTPTAIPPTPPPNATPTPVRTPTVTPVVPSSPTPVPPPNPLTYGCYQVVPGGGGPNGVNNDIRIWQRVGGGACP